MHYLNLSPSRRHLARPFKLLHLLIYQFLDMIVLSSLLKTDKLVLLSNNMIETLVERRFFNLTCLPLERRILVLL